MERADRYHASLTDDGHYRMLVEAISDYAIYMLNPHGVIMSWNPGARRFKGYEAAEIIGDHFSRFYTEEDRRAGLPEKALSLAAKEGRYETEGWRVRKNGNRFWAHVLIDPIRAPLGTLVGFAKVTRDLTERRAAQEALLRSEAQFRILVQSVTDCAIYMLDVDGRLTTWNPGAARISGYDASEVIGKNVAQFYTQAERDAGVPQAVLAAAARDGRVALEGWRVRKDGTVLRAHVVIDAIRGSDGAVVGFAGVMRDISDRSGKTADPGEPPPA